MIAAITAALSALWTGAKAFAASSAGKALGTAALGVGANVAGAKIKDEMGLTPAQIGTGTGAGVQAGTEMEYTPVGEDPEGSDISGFEWQDPNKDSTNEEELMALLSQAGINQQGVMSAAIGGYLKKANGGSIKIPNVAITPNIPPPTLAPRVPPEMNTIGKMMTAVENMPAHMAEWYEGLDPETKKAINKTLTDIGTSMALKAAGLGPVGRTTTPPAAGNANRRAIQFNPIGAKNGGTLNRPMFMPHGGAMRGPGGPKEDLIPVMASNGEYMLSKAAVDQAGGGNHRLGIAKLNAFNNRGNRRYG